MKTLITLLLLLPLAVFSQELQFRMEFDTIPVEINGWHPYQPWVGGFGEPNPAIVDFDHDSDLDLFIGTYEGYISYFKNEGTATQANFKTMSLQLDNIYVTESRNNPCFVDIDADGDYDIITGDVDGFVYLFRNIGSSSNPQFVLETNSLVPAPPWCLAPELVDIDADGDYDLFGAWQQIVFYRNDGTPQNYNFQLVTSNFGNITTPAAASVDFVDIDADGDYDLFIGNVNASIYFYRNDGTPQDPQMTYVTSNYNNINVGSYSSPEFADIEGDGDFDLIVGRSQETTSISPGDLFYYENIGTPWSPRWRFITTNFLSLDEGYTIESSAMTDINADGDQDLFNQNTGVHISYYENTGTPLSATFTWQTYAYQDISVNSAGLEFCDVDGDGDQDLFLGDGAIPGPPHLWLYRNIGTPQSANFSLYSNNLIQGVFTQNTVCIRPGVADIDNDGDYDLFLGDMDNHFYYFQNYGSPTNFNFILNSTNWQNVLPDTCSYLLLYPTFYDIDNDGDLDLFLGMKWVWNQLWFYRNVGTPQNAEMVLETTTFFGDSLDLILSSINIVDIDNDGDGDFFCSANEGGIVFYRNITGDTTAVPLPGTELVHNYRQTLTINTNPSNPISTISFSLPSPQEATLSVYNLLGSKVTSLVSGRLSAGEHNVSWDATGNASGIYLIQLLTPQQAVVRKLVVIK